MPSHPLFFALALIIGTASAFTPLALPLSLVFCRKWPLLLVTFGAFFVGVARLPPPISETTIEGRGLFRIERVRKTRSFFYSNWLYEGRFLHFEGEEGVLRSIPARIYTPLYKKRPLATCDYWIEGTLLRHARTFSIFKPTKGKPWEEGPKRRSLVEWRFNQKSRIRSFLQSKMTDYKARSFVAALATGELEEKSVSAEFGRLGLSHILAISGFHFSLLTLFLAFAVKRCFKEQVAAALLIAALTLFFLYMGPSNAITRAWIGFLVPLAGTLFRRRTEALRALSLALIIALIIDPAALGSLGFQLSYAATFGLLLLYPFFERLLQKLLLKRTYKEALKMSLIDQIGYLVATALRHSLALNGAAAVATLPLLLFHFGRFPLLSLVYNFFFPPLTALLLFLLLLSFALPPLFLPTEKLASFLIILTQNSPRRLDFYLRPMHLLYFLPLILLTKRSWIRENCTRWRS